MSDFLWFVEAAGRTPAWISLLAAPVLSALSAVAFFLFGGRKFFSYTAAALGTAGFALVCCASELRVAFVWLALYLAESALLRLFLTAPAPRRAKEKRSREARVYDKFHLDLIAGEETEKTPPRGQKDLPPKISCFTEEETVDTEESGLRLAHVTELLEKLRRASLSAGDRLETDVLSRTIDGFRNRRLTMSEVNTLTDCLASVLKLTAKYKL
ncbi:MAG: hypothetical protein ACI4NG_04205 [Candidatus Gallimonas sp.]